VDKLQTKKKNNIKKKTNWRPTATKIQKRAGNSKQFDSSLRQAVHEAFCNSFTMATATASSSKGGGMSFFGTIMHFLRRRDTTAAPKGSLTTNTGNSSTAKSKAATLANYEDELRLLLDTSTI